MKVSIVKCPDYSEESLRKGMENLLNPLGGIKKFVRKTERVLLKPNLLFPSIREKAVNTDPAFVCAVAELVLSAGAKPIIGDSPAFGTARQVARKCGLFDYAQKIGVEVVEFNRPVSVELKDGFLMKKVTVDRTVLEADCVINLPKLKTHQQLGFTGAIKNTFGCVNGKRKTLMHLRFSGREMDFGKMLIDVHNIVRPALNIVDGIIAMDGMGPRKGSPREFGLIIAGDNALAVDRVIKELIKIPFYPYFLMAADELGLKPESISEIDITGAEIEKLKVNDFAFPVFYPVGFSPFRIVKSIAKDILTRIGLRAVA